MPVERTAALDVQSLTDTLSTFETEGRTGWCVAQQYPDNIRTRMEAWQDIVLELDRRLAWFEYSGEEKIALVKEPLKRELRRVVAEMQESIKWSENMERQRNAAKAKLPPLEGEIARIQATLNEEVKNHLATREDLRTFKEQHYTEIQQWKETLATERRARDQSLQQHAAEIHDLQERRRRAEELLEDQKKSLEWKDEVIAKYKAKLTAAEDEVDAGRRKVEGLERQVKYAAEELEREKVAAAATLASTVAMLKEQHQLEIDAINEARARDKLRHQRELQEKDDQMANERAVMQMKMTELRKKLEAEKKKAIEAEEAKTRAVARELQECQTNLANERKAHAKTRTSFFFIIELQYDAVSPA